MKTRLNDIGADPMPMTPVDFGKLIANETEKWAEVIRAANIKPSKIDNFANIRHFTLDR